MAKTKTAHTHELEIKKMVTDRNGEFDKWLLPLPEGDLKCISIDCPDKEVMPIPPEDIPKAFASFFNIKIKEK